jgi:hypothetical protein
MNRRLELRRYVHEAPDFPDFRKMPHLDINLVSKANEANMLMPSSPSTRSFSSARVQRDQRIAERGPPFARPRSKSFRWR